MHYPEYLNFKLESRQLKPQPTDVDQLSPIPIKRSSLMQQYQRKMENALNTHNHINSQNFETPAWSSLVDTDKPTSKRTQSTAIRQEILRKIIESPSKNDPLKQRSPRYSNINNNRLHTTSSYAKFKAPTPGMNLASELTERTKQLKPSKSNRSYQSVKKLPKKQDDSSRFKQISVHDHLYLDSKRQQAKKMMHKLVDEEFKKNIMSFKPKISHYTELLAQNRYKRMNQDPDYRCSRKKIQNKKLSIKVQDPTEVQYRYLHIFFSQITTGSHVLSRSTLNTENIPLPCLRSIQPLLQQVFMGANLTWANFLSLFYAKSLNRKAFFQLLKHKQKLQSRDSMISSSQKRLQKQEQELN